MVCITIFHYITHSGCSSTDNPCRLIYYIGMLSTHPSHILTKVSLSLTRCMQGDIGVFQPAGEDGPVLKIIDRKKNIFKLAQGEYVAAEKIEATYAKDPVVDQVWVYGNSFESALVGAVVPNPENLKALCAKNGITGTHAELCAKPEVNKLVLDSMNATGKADKLKGFEFVKRIILESKPFDQKADAELMTPTFKLKRPQLLKYYQTQIDALYEEMRSGAAAS